MSQKNKLNNECNEVNENNENSKDNSNKNAVINTDKTTSNGTHLVYSFFNNVPMEYTLKIKKKEIKLSEVYKLLDRESKFYKNFSNTYKIYEKKIC